MLLVGNNSIRHFERNCADPSSRGGIIRSNSAAARRFRLSARNRPDPPRVARNRACNGMELRGDVPFANLLIPTREITAGRRRKRVFAKLVASIFSTISPTFIQNVSSSIVDSKFILPYSKYSNTDTYVVLKL